MRGTQGVSLGGLAAVASLQQARVFFVGVCFDQGLGIAPQVTPTEKIQPDFASKRAFVRQSTCAAVARAEPYFGQMSIVRCAANQKGGAADARLSFDRGHNDLHRFHLCFVDCSGKAATRVAATVRCWREAARFPRERFTRAL